MVSRIAPPETAGVFAQTALFTRVLYLLGALVLQVTWPYRLRVGQGQEPAERLVLVRRVELAAVALLAVSAPVNAMVLPWIASRLAGVDLSSVAWWIALSTLNFAALLALFRMVQIRCAEQRLRAPSAGLVVVTVGLFVVSSASRGDVTRYLPMALTVYVLGIAVVRFWGSRSAPPSLGRAS